MTETLESWKAERNRALSDLDMDWARFKMPNASNDEVRLSAMHKARVDCTEIDRELRLASVEWLRERGLRRMGGFGLPPRGELPE